MQTYELTVRGRSISASPSNRTLVRTSIGVDQIHVLFDSAEWLDFPIEVTFGQGDDKVTQPVVMSAIQGSQDWAAETTATVPWEVVDGNGSIAVTFQGTDSQGRHLITAKGAPLRVTEAGDVVAGGEPSDAPSVSQWQQAYADAMAAVNQAASLVANLQQSLESMVSEAEGAISSAVEEAEQSIGSIQPATAESLGVVRIGEGIDVDQNGVISTSGGSGMTDAQRTDLARLKSLSAAMADATYSGSSVTGSPKVKPSALPVANVTTPGAVIPDGATIKVDQYGMIHSYVGEIEPATVESIGGVKPDGTTITIEEDGTIHGVEQTPISTTSTAGKVKPDGETITVESDGTIHGTEQTPIATTAVAGKVKPDGTTITVDADGAIHGAARSDWNQGDPSANGYIANRPFYETPTRTAILDRHYIGRQYGDESLTTSASVSSMVVGKTYAVTMADEQGLYVGTAELDSTSDEDGYPVVSGAFSGNAFEITYIGDGVALITLHSYADSDGNNSFGGVTVTIELLGSVVTQLPSKFVPPASESSVGGVKPDGTSTTTDGDGTMHAAPADWASLEGEAGHVVNRPFYEDETETVLLDRYYVQGQSFTSGSEPSYIEVAAVPLGAAMVSGKTYRVYVYDRYGVYYGSGNFTSSGAFPTLDVTLGARLTITSSTAQGRYVNVRLYGSRVSSQDTVYFGDMEITVKLFETELVKLPPKFIPIASASSIGGIKPDGTTITVGADGTASAVSGYTLPVATPSRLGGVKPDGTTITVSGDGTIRSASAYTLPDATTTSKGGVIVGDGINVSGGTISVPTPDWDAGEGEDGHILNRPCYDGNVWTQVASGTYSSERSSSQVDGFYIDAYNRRVWTGSSFDPTLPARLTRVYEYDIAFSRSGDNWVATTENGQYRVIANRASGGWYFELRCAYYNSPNGSFTIHSYAATTIRLPQRFVDYSPCSPAVGPLSETYELNGSAYLLTMYGAAYSKANLYTLSQYVLRQFYATLSTDSQTVCGAIDELHGRMSSFATTAYVQGQMERLDSMEAEIASLRRTVRRLAEIVDPDGVQADVVGNTLQLDGTTVDVVNGTLEIDSPVAEVSGGTLSL